MLKLTDISHSFSGQPVLTHVSLTVGPGERIALMGPSGVGKTTVLRIAAGLLRPDSGSVVCDFEKIATVFQEPRLLPWRTAAENVNLVLSDGPATMSRAREVLAALSLKAAADKYPAELSGGMQQRVALARALAYGGDLLLLDEPFKAMDERLRRSVMARVAETSAAILLVTHDEAEAKLLNCRIVTL